MPERSYQKLMDKGATERWKFAVELGRHGKAAVDLLIASLKDEDKWVRYLIIDALGNIQDPRVIDPLVTVGAGCVTTNEQPTNTRGSRTRSPGRRASCRSMSAAASGPRKSTRPVSSASNNRCVPKKLRLKYCVAR